MEPPSPLGHTEPVNDMEMYYEIRGEGEPLVLLHGGGGIGANWELIFKVPPEGFQLVIPDLRGHGRSTNPSEEFTFRQAALDVFALLDRLGIERFKAIGMSLGAKTLLHVATQQPSRVEAMVLVSATPYFPEQARAIMRQVIPENRSDAEWQQMRQWHRHGDEQIRKLWRQTHAFADSYDDMSFTPPYLSTITARTLIVHGDRDPLYPVHLAMGCTPRSLARTSGPFRTAVMAPSSATWPSASSRPHWPSCAANGKIHNLDARSAPLEVYRCHADRGQHLG